MTTADSFALQHCLPRDSINPLLNKPKSAFHKSKAEVLLNPLLISLRIKNSHFVMAMLSMASSHHITHKSFSVHREGQCRVPSLAGSLTSCVRKLFSTHSRNLPEFVFSAVLYFQQISDKLDLPVKARTSDIDNR